MAFSGVLLRSSRPLCRQVQSRGFFHGRSEGGSIFLTSLSSAGQKQDASLMQAHIPVLNGNAVSFGVSGAEEQSLDDGAEKLLKSFEVFGSSGIANRLFQGDLPVADTKQSLDDGTLELLKSFEVANSSEIANRLFQGIEVRVKSIRRKAAVEARRKPYPVPSLSDQMIARFGTGENVSALVCRFGRVAYDIANSENRSQKRDIVMSAVEEILGSQRLASSEIDAIVDAVSAAQQQEVTYTAANVVRFLSFANVWQKFNAEQRRLLSSGPDGCRSGKMATDGLVDGLKAFERSWQNLTVAEQCLAKEKLCSMAQQNLSNFKVVDEPESVSTTALQHA